MASGLRLPPLKTAQIRNFSGGENLRDAQGELAPNETPDAWNVTLDERGGVSKRLGFQKYNSSVYDATAKVTNMFYSGVLQKLVVQCGASVYLDTSTTLFKTFTTSARVGFADFNGKLYIVHPVDGLFESDGTVVGTTHVAASPVGVAIYPSQNRLLMVDGTTSTLRASKIGDATDWTTGAGHGWTNQIREKDNEPLVAIGSSAGVDVFGRPGVLIFKRRSTYRVYDFSDATGGAYETIDPAVGAASSLSVVSFDNRTIVLSERGVFWTDGTSPLKQVTSTWAPLFTPQQVAYDQIDKWCAGWRGDRVYMSLPRAGSSTNDLSIEYHPEQGWLVPGSDAAGAYATYQKNDQKLLAAAPSTNGQVYEKFKGGSDDGAPIASWFQTRWFEPNAGYKTRMRKLRVIGRGNFDLYLRKDYELANGKHLSVAITGDAGVYDAPGSVYDTDDSYGPLKSQEYQDFKSLGVCRAVSFRVEETSTVVSTGLQLFGTGTAPEIGAWSLYGLDLQHVQLGLS
jgi:hypothetical protein